MFNDKFLLTEAILDGTKTMTRRVIKKELPIGNWEETQNKLPYKVGDVVAVAQRYSDIGAASFERWEEETDWFNKGFSNKMFVRAEYMPHHIRITDVKIEHLQDITDEDCLKEGIMDVIPADDESKCEGYGYRTSDGGYFLYNTPREAFESLINKISGSGTWKSNPLVAAYSFELVDYSKLIKY